jgi:hypothetical protein
MNRFPRTLSLLALLTIILLSSCARLDLVNQSDEPTRLLLQLPDQGHDVTTMVPAGESVTSTSVYGGRYKVMTLPDAEYRKLLADLQTTLRTRLFATNDPLTPAEVRELVAMIHGINGRLEAIAADGETCRGVVSDYDTVQIAFQRDARSADWQMRCAADD